MKIVLVWDAIKAILETDDLTKKAIKQYRKQFLEKGIASTPVCLIGRYIKIPLKRQYLSDAAGTRSGSLLGITTVAILGRAYRAAYGDDESETLDVIQDNIATVLNKHTNHTLGGTVHGSRVINMSDIHINALDSGEYFGFELILEFDKTE